MANIKYWREVANSGRGSKMTACLHAACDEIARLQGIIDSRPAINAGLPESYIEWSQGLYVLDATNATQTAQ